jgi:hypothetical protein
VGVQYSIKFEDSSRDDRAIVLTIWYPAIPPEGSTGGAPIRDAEPDPSGGHLLVPSSTKASFIFGPISFTDLSSINGRFKKSLPAHEYPPTLSLH